MKRILFVLVSAFFAVTSFAANLGKDVVTKIVNDDESTISQQNETLILEQPAGYEFGVADHYSHSSHSSHGSHGSHGSHSSHSSHYSSR